jgi:hypothetical protein
MLLFLVFDYKRKQSVTVEWFCMEHIIGRF